MKPIEPIKILVRIGWLGLACVVSLHAAAVIGDRKELHRIGTIATFVTVGIASLPLVGFLIYVGIERLKQSTGGKKGKH